MRTFDMLLTSYHTTSTPHAQKKKVYRDNENIYFELPESGLKKI